MVCMAADIPAGHVGLLRAHTVGGEIQGTHADKFDACKKCDFFQKVAKEEGDAFLRPPLLLSKLKNPSRRIDVTTKKFGILIGGSGFIGGALMYHWKTIKAEEVEILSPNSKKLSLRVPEDIKQYFSKYRPDFIVNAAIAPLDSDAQMAYEINYLGSINLAKAALALKIPYVHFSSAATLPPGENLTEEEALPLSYDLSNYAKSKLMTEKTLAHLHETRGLDCTIVKLGVAYGKHDHKIQGFTRLLYMIARQSMPAMLTRRGVLHSYTHTKKIPPFIHYILEHREEFSGQTYHFVDQNPIELRELILTIKCYLEVSMPKEICISYPVSRVFTGCIKWILKGLSRIGVEARVPAEMMFMENFYKTQTLSVGKLRRSSYGLPDRETSLFTQLPSIIEYYISRWEHLNLISSFNVCFYDPLKQAQHFSENSQHLLDAIHEARIDPLGNYDELSE